MVWPAIAGAVIGGAISRDEGNKNRRAAAKATPKFAKELQSPIKRQLGRLKDTRRDVYSGDRVADFSGNQQEGFAMVPNMADALASQAGTTAAGFEQFAGGGMVGANPFLDDAIAGMRETAMRDLERNQLPAVRNTAIATGGVGGSRQGIAEGLALSDMNRDLINAEGQMRANQFNQDMTNMLSALTNQGAILSGQTAPMDLLMRTGGLQQAQQQAEIEGSMAGFNEEQDAQFQRDQQLLSILLGTPAAQTPMAPQSSPLAAGLGTALAAQQLFGSRGAPAPTPVYGMGQQMNPFNVGTYNPATGSGGF